MASGHVLQFPRSDKEGAFVIVHVTPTRSKALDVKLVGTDGVEPYAVSLRHDKVVSLRVKSSPCSDEEWVSILTAVIRQEPLDDVEVVASVEDESSVTLNVRKKGKEFTQRLGAIELSHSPRELIELYDWCGLSAQTASEAKEALALATAKASKLEESVRGLKAHLDELIVAKEAHETELLEKFRDLLNEKKVKIRQQQKLLASVAAPGKSAAPSVKEEDPTQEPNSRGSGARRAAGKSRPTKRKAAPPPVEEDESTSDEFEKMDLDASAKRSAELSDQEQDTTEDDDATASEDDEEEPAAVSPAKRAPPQQPAPVNEAPKPAAKDVPPPKRELPFARKKQAAVKAPPPPADSETESDDEL
ncbi:mitotic apparatus protein p62-like protein [Colletotrichum kahawae]|uniref:Mitotic apparatus protein p62-like protein n=1 Tax=Colletotrichum kahawae TaxID=34407 RepID=A0AAE0DGW7_COLKA|nr:mitotic apparatus protein p62-like protein [Colletotrichum kahawae]